MKYKIYIYINTVKFSGDWANGNITISDVANVDNAACNFFRSPKMGINSLNSVLLNDRKVFMSSIFCSTM